MADAKLVKKPVPQWWCTLGTVAALVAAETKKDAEHIMIGRVLGPRAERVERLKVRVIPATERHAAVLESYAQVEMQLKAAKATGRKR